MAPGGVLVQLPGIGVPSAVQLLAVIRYSTDPNPHELVGCAGLGAGVHSSGQEHYGGGITKQGRRDVRKTMVDVAWVAVANHFYWKAVFDASPIASAGTRLLWQSRASCWSWSGTSSQSKLPTERPSRSVSLASFSSGRGK